jgi:hypothetical protein
MVMPGSYDSGASLTSRRFHGQPSHDLPQSAVGQRIEHPIRKGGLMTDFKHDSTQSASQRQSNLCRSRLTGEAECRTVKLPTFPKSEIGNQKSEMLSGSRLDGTGGWKPLELGEIVAHWNELRTSAAPKEEHR